MKATKGNTFLKQLSDAVTVASCAKEEIKASELLMFFDSRDSEANAPIKGDLFSSLSGFLHPTWSIEFMQGGNGVIHNLLAKQSETFRQLSRRETLRFGFKGWGGDKWPFWKVDFSDVRPSPYEGPVGSKSKWRVSKNQGSHSNRKQITLQSIKWA